MKRRQFWTSLLTNSTKLKKLKQVRPEDFDVKALLAAAREGRLYVDESKKELSRDVVIKEVRAYIGRIKVFATKKYNTSIDGLWEQILSTEDFVLFLTPSCKAKKCREFNKYSVMRIIGVLREKDVYEHQAAEYGRARGNLHQPQFQHLVYLDEGGYGHYAVDGENSFYGEVKI